MVLFNSINDIVSNNTDPCYYEYASSPNDISFQIPIANAPTIVGLSIAVLNPATYVFEEDVSAKFTVGAANGMLTFTLNDFSPFMCSCKKFILRVTCSNPAFIYYLGIYKIDNCCPTEYTVNIGGDITPSTTDGSDDAPTPAYTMTCRDSNLKFVTWNDCEDLFTGEVFIDGFRKITNLQGRIVKVPRTIEKTLARNCKVLRVESAEMYNVEIYDYLPEWKMDEMTLQLQHQYITINNERFVFTEGTPAQILSEVCTPTYIMNFNVMKCPIRQNFGCGDICNPSGAAKEYYYKIPESTDLIYSEDREYIGTGSSAVLDGLNGSYGAVSSDENIPEGYIEFETHGAPPTFYYNGTLPKDASFPYTDPDLVPDVILCPKPVIGAIVVTDVTCAAPVLGMITITETGTADPMYIINVKAYTGNGTDTQVFPEISGRELLSIELNGQSYTSDFWVQTGDSVSWINPYQVFEGVVVLTWNSKPYYSAMVYSAKTVSGNGLNSQSFPELVGRELITIEMEGQSYTSDYWVQTSSTITWNDPMKVFEATLVITWNSSS